VTFLMADRLGIGFFGCPENPRKYQAFSEWIGSADFPTLYIPNIVCAWPAAFGLLRRFYGVWMSVCTLIVISHWPLRRTQTRAAR